MSYFNRFPVVSGYDIIGRTFNMMDITRRTGFLRGLVDNEALYVKHEVQDGESPIVLADRMYDDSNLYWVIMLFNSVYDINADWPLDSIALNRYVNRVYDDPYGIHHYESIATGAIVNQTWPEYDRISITNYDYEIDINDKKREIKVPVPEAVTRLVQEHNRLIQQ